jgi:arginyl-tRNA synthetase
MPHNTQIVEIDPDSPHFFTVLHTHARCCALLSRAHEGNLIQLATSTSQVSTAITIARALPWLTDTDISLRFQQDQEWNLIGQFSDTLSYLSLSATDSKANQTATKVAHDLSRAFQTFYAACPIWGEAKQNLALAQARLGLVSITQRILGWLLETKLGQIAPTDL